MRHTGALKSWNDERGFGFITPDGARQDVFVHISAFPAINGRPLGGERLGFDLELDREGRQRAVHVRVLPPLGLFQSGGRVDDLPAAWTAPRLLIIPVFGGIYGASLEDSRKDAALAVAVRRLAEFLRTLQQAI